LFWFVNWFLADHTYVMVELLEQVVICLSVSLSVCYEYIADIVKS